jgi:uncharacterized protein YigE (DUF2233 family)
MRNKNKINPFSQSVILILLIGITLSISVLYAFQPNEETIVFTTVNPKNQIILMNWKDKKGDKLNSIKQLINYHKQQSLQTILQ